MNCNYVFWKILDFSKKVLWVKRLQSYKLSKLEIWKDSAARLKSNHTLATHILVLENGFNLKIWWTITGPVTFDCTSLERSNTYW